ncbi:uncharacterized protein LOC132716318 [Ruditapes philippinarum]|uniref:uncharacterized protein LOC132716318 n=1 Tax=Ruditapes philippinarum TaxID=129788 RepID=UPI00295B96B2|nr:uncharacterized protein LOC132716318 [Ruditapes philippinarum]
MTARTATGNDDIDPYANDLAGQVYNPDTQCEMMQGKGSFLYRNKYKSDFSTICSTLFCAIPKLQGYTHTKIPWYGTTCGNGKMCQLGHCVESPLAPPVDDEACPFGDTPYIVPHKRSGCSDLLGSPATTFNCYHEQIRKDCCATCEAIKKTNRAYVDCDYGDKQSFCVGMTLQLCRINFETCCKTCQDIRLDIPGCPWGDEYTDCTQSHCTNDYSKCCKTCAALTTAADSPSATGTFKPTANTADTITTNTDPDAAISTTNTTTSAKSNRMQISPRVIILFVFISILFRHYVDMFIYFF